MLNKKAQPFQSSKRLLPPLPNLYFPYNYIIISNTQKKKLPTIMTELKEDQENHHHHQQQQQQSERRRLCDFCGNNTALLYCRADSAKLCFTCDREVHSTNQLFTKHTRWLLCNLCDSSPASILCSTESCVFCQNCDWESHDKQSALHERRPLEGFNGCPCVSELLSILGFEDLRKKELLYGGGESVCCDGGYGFSDWVIWDTPSVVSIDDLIANNDSGHNFQAIGVPPLPKVLAFYPTLCLFMFPLLVDFEVET